MRTIILLLNFLLLSTLAFPQTGWINYSTGINRTIRGIYFINSETGWFVGDTTAIFKTTNGGLNWTSKPVYYVVPIRLYSVKFTDNNTGFAVGGHEAPTGPPWFYYQYIYKTTDGGDNWALHYNVQGGGDYLLNDIYYSPVNIFVTGSGGSIEGGSTGGISKSINGGYNFSLIMSKGSATSLSFINSNTGWVNSYFVVDYSLSMGYIMKTTNGGLNWIEQYKDSAMNFGSMKVNDIQFVNEFTGFAIGNKSGSKFFKTSNGGTNWIINDFPNGENATLFFTDQNTGWIGGLSGQDTSCISYTSDGGNTWMKQKRRYSGFVYCFYFINNQTGWAGLANGQIMKTTNGGITNVDLISSSVPASFSLNQNYPNPFNPSTTIRYALPKAGVVRLAVYDVMGREVEMLVNEKQAAGSYEATFDGTRFASGVYFYRLTAEGYGETMKMMLIR